MKSVKRNNPRAEKMMHLRKRRIPSAASPGHVRLADGTMDIDSTEAKIKREIAIMKKLRHPHVVRLYEVIDDRMREKIYMGAFSFLSLKCLAEENTVMEYLGGGEVKWRDDKYNPVLTVQQTRRIMRDAVLGLEYLHYQGIIHRDIKPANLLWTEDRRQVKIGDFGVSHFSYAQRLAAREGAEGGHAEGEEDVDLWDDRGLTRRAGTPSFLAPEIVWEHSDMHSACPSTSSSPGGPWSSASPSPSTLSLASTLSFPKPEITKSIDVWALGVTLYCLLFGQTPFVVAGGNGGGGGVGNEWALYKLICNSDWTPRETIGYDRQPGKLRHPPQTHASYTLLSLLDAFLKKDYKERITLEQVKKSEWLLEDLRDREGWLDMTRVGMAEVISVSGEEAGSAMSDVRFRWRWGGKLVRQVSSLFGMKGGEGQPVEKKVVKTIEPPRHAPPRRNQSAAALPPPPPTTTASTAPVIPPPKTPIKIPKGANHPSQLRSAPSSVITTIEHVHAVPRQTIEEREKEKKARFSFFPRPNQKPSISKMDKVGLSTSPGWIPSTSPPYSSSSSSRSPPPQTTTSSSSSPSSSPTTSRSPVSLSPNGRTMGPPNYPEAYAKRALDSGSHPPPSGGRFTLGFGLGLGGMRRSEEVLRGYREPKMKEGQVDAIETETDRTNGQRVSGDGSDSHLQGFRDEGLEEEDEDDDPSRRLTAARRASSWGQGDSEGYTLQYQLGHPSQATQPHGGMYAGGHGRGMGIMGLGLGGEGGGLTEVMSFTSLDQMVVDVGAGVGGAGVVPSSIGQFDSRGSVNGPRVDSLDVNGTGSKGGLPRLSTIQTGVGGSVMDTVMNVGAGGVAFGPIPIPTFEEELASPDEHEDDEEEEGDDDNDDDHTPGIGRELDIDPFRSHLTSRLMGEGLNDRPTLVRHGTFEACHPHPHTLPHTLPQRVGVSSGLASVVSRTMDEELGLDGTEETRTEESEDSEDEDDDEDEDEAVTFSPKRRGV